MGIWDSLASAGSWLGNNSSWIKPVAEFGVGLYERNQQEKGRQQYFDALKASEDRNYQDQLDYNAYLESLGEGGGGGPSAAAQAAALAAARKMLEKKFAEARKFQKPFYDAGVEVLPGVVKNYKGASDVLSLLTAYASKADEMNKLGQGTAAWNTNVPVPSYLK